MNSAAYIASCALMRQRYISMSYLYSLTLATPYAPDNSIYSPSADGTHDRCVQHCRPADESQRQRIQQSQRSATYSASTLPSLRVYTSPSRQNAWCRSSIFDYTASLPDIDKNRSFSALIKLTHPSSDPYRTHTTPFQIELTTSVLALFPSRPE